MDTTKTTDQDQFIVDFCKEQERIRKLLDDVGVKEVDGVSAGGLAASMAARMAVGRKP